MTAGLSFQFVPFTLLRNFYGGILFICRCILRTLAFYSVRYRWFCRDFVAATEPDWKRERKKPRPSHGRRSLKGLGIRH